MKTSILPLLILALLVLGCGGEQNPEGSSSGSRPAEDGVREPVARPSHDRATTEGPSPPDFSDEGYYPWSWYSVSEAGAGGRIEDGFVTYDQGELLRYFAERHRQRERLELIEVSSTQAGLLGEKNNVGIVYVLTRDAEDLEPGLGGPARIAFGKGAINCENRQIFAWSMEMRVGETRSERKAAAGLCTDPPGWKPGTAVVACT